VLNKADAEKLTSRQIFKFYIMQQNVDKIKTYYPDSTIRVEGQTAKFSQKELTQVDILKLYSLDALCKKINVKRSGTGLTVIFTF
jgi:hypothetical protein